jgi:SAM-dependent methyltransferase
VVRRLLRHGMAAVREMAARDWDRVAPEYFSEVASPLRSGVPRPLLRALDAVPARLRGTVADLGCGLGLLLPALADRFHRVLAIDFSRAMLARARAGSAGRAVTCHRADLADLSAFRRRLDVAVTVNAVLTPDPDRLERVFASIHDAIQPRGWLIGVFPAMEAVLYQGYLIHERERRRHEAESARRRTSRLIEAGRYDFVHATYSEAERTQKFFYAFELRHRLRRAGFSRVRIGRLVHPWADVGERFPGEPAIWDWLVQAIVPARER